MGFINEIIENSEDVIYIRNKKHYLYKSSEGLIPINLWIDNNVYLNGCQYIEGTYNVLNKTIVPFKGQNTYLFGWVWSNPQQFLNKYSERNLLKFIHYSFRKYGQPKLAKPHELKGIKQAFSVNYIFNKCKCQIFIEDNNIWIKHKDYFSPCMEEKYEDLGTPLIYRAKKYFNQDINKQFIYPDTWGSIVLRNEAWICIKNLLYRLKMGSSESELLYAICRQQEQICNFKMNMLCGTEMERFWENVIKQCVKYLYENNDKM